MGKDQEAISNCRVPIEVQNSRQGHEHEHEHEHVVVEMCKDHDSKPFLAWHGSEWAVHCTALH